MKQLTTICAFICIMTVSFGQTTGSNQLITAEKITPGSSLFIQYDYGTCWINHERQIIIEATQSDSLMITIKKRWPVGYRLYKYKSAKKYYEAQDSIQIKEPLTFKFPKMGERDYCTVTREYLLETSFTVSRLSLTRFLNEFIYLADNKKLELSGTGIAGLYCYIQLKQNNLTQEYSFDGWYYLEKEIQRQK
jgi:hypothetical protein